MACKTCGDMAETVASSFYSYSSPYHALFVRMLVFRKGVREEQGELWGISNLMKFSGESMLLDLRQKYGNGLPPLVPDSKVCLSDCIAQVATGFRANHACCRRGNPATVSFPVEEAEICNVHT